VVLESGLGNDGQIWSQVQPEVGSFTRACAYDRAGLGKSSAAPRPHTSREMAGELHALLGKAGIAAPYVLVGHSLGGLNARLFASEHPEEVAGMVLVDSATEEQDARLWSLIPEEAMREFRASLAEHPEGIDLDAFRASMADVHRSSRSLGDIPLVVLTHGKEQPAPPGGPPDLGARLERLWQEVQSELPRLSTNSAHFIARSSGHHIQKDAPRLTIAAIREVVRAARAHAKIDGSAMEALTGEEAP